jgi:ComF family protein
MQMLNDLFNFAFPRNCLLCGRLLNDSEVIICTICYYNIPRTDFHRYKDNPVARLFWGRTEIEYATAYFYFSKGGAYQKLIHGLKYQGRMDIGIETGRLFGSELKGSCFDEVDCLVPVPLHPKKQRKRGYNQSEMIAKGIAKALDKPVLTDILLRAEMTATQTRKSRFDRYTNVAGNFYVKNPGLIMEQHLLLVDDVVTTGSTLEACIEILRENAIEKISIAALCVA